MLKYLKIFLVPLILAVVFLPHQASAVSWFPLVPCGLSAQPKDSSGVEIPKSVHDYMQDCNQCLLVELGKNFVDMTFFAIVPSIGTLLFLYAGFRILLNARSGNASAVADGKKIMTATAAGIAIVLSAWLITNFILKSVAPNQAAGVCLNSGVCDTDASKSCKTNSDCPGTPWYQIQCRVGTLKDIVDQTNPSLPKVGGGGGTGSGGTDGTNGGGGNGTGGSNGSGNGAGGADLPGGNCTGVACNDSSLNICVANSSADCSDSNVNQWDAQIRAAAAKNQIGSGIDTVAMVKAIMSQESHGVSQTSYDGTSFGIMQIRPATGESYKNGCTTAAVTSSWLLDTNNAQASICIAINYLRHLTSQCGTTVRNLAAGYNGGGEAKGACQPSTSCQSCSMCGSEVTMRWECPWDGADGVHQACNVDRTDSNGAPANFSQTRKYAPSVQYCYNKFGGTSTGPAGETTKTTNGGSTGVSTGPTGTGSLDVSAVTPETVMAGKEASFDQSTGVVTYTYADVPFEITGSNLTGSMVSIDNTGIDGKPGIELKDLQTTETSIKGDMLVHSTAKEGETWLTIKNSDHSTTTSIRVGLAGTQYLQRMYASNSQLSFRGDWKYPVPSTAMDEFTVALDSGLKPIETSSYKNIGIKARVYENSYWLAHSPCTHNTQNFSANDTAGCADPSGSHIIEVRDVSALPPPARPLGEVVLHEAAHQLQFINRTTGFQSSWVNTVGDISGCKYLPPQTVKNAWNDGSGGAHCSFIEPYGAADLKTFDEDVATMASDYIFESSYFSDADVKTDPRYDQKLTLLRKYGFLQ